MHFELNSIYFIDYCISQISKQIKQRTRIGKIFARWHLAIAITSLSSILKSSSTITLEIPFHQRNKCRSENETIVNLRNRTEEKSRRQTSCDNPTKPLKLHIPLNTFFVAEPLMLSEFPIKHASLSNSSVLSSSSFCRPVPSCCVNSLIATIRSNYEYLRTTTQWKL